jgi:hypothetical protein
VDTRAYHNHESVIMYTIIIHWRFQKVSILIHPPRRHVSMLLLLMFNLCGAIYHLGMFTGLASVRYVVEVEKCLGPKADNDRGKFLAPADPTTDCLNAALKYSRNNFISNSIKNQDALGKSRQWNISFYMMHLHF